MGIVTQTVSPALLDRYATPEAVAWFDFQIPAFAGKNAQTVTTTFRDVKVTLEPNRYLSKSGFDLLVRARSAP